MAANSQRSDGMIMPFLSRQRWRHGHPARPDDRGFAEHWVSTLWEYYQFTSDLQTIREFYSNAVKVMEYFTRYVDENGLVGAVPPWIFGDWVTLDRRGENAIVNALFYNNLLEVSRMAKLLGRLSSREAAPEKRQHILSYIFDKDRIKPGKSN